MLNEPTTEKLQALRLHGMLALPQALAPPTTSSRPGFARRRVRATME
jgi:hypothetical protein